MGALPAHTRLGWWWDELGKGLGPFPSCGTLAPAVLLPLAKHPAGQLRQLSLPTLLTLRGCILPALTALHAWPLVASWGTCSAMPDGHRQQPCHHLCPGAHSPVGCQHPWGHHPAQSGLPGAEVGTRMGEAAQGALPEHLVQLPNMCQPHAPLYQGCPSCHPLSPACSLPCLPAHTLFVTLITMARERLAVDPPLLPQATDSYS